MGLIKSVFNMVKKPLDMGLKQLPIMMRSGSGVLPNIISLATTVVPMISEIVTGYKNDNAIKEVRALQDDTRTISVMANENNDINLLAMEAVPYIKAMTKDYKIMMNELGIEQSELDEYVALYLLERLKCPPKYIEAIIKTLKLNKKIKESGIINDAIETSRLHVDNIKNVFNIGRELYSTDYILETLESDMKPKKIITSEGADLLTDRYNKVELILDLTKDVTSNKGIKKIEKNIDGIMYNEHEDYANQYMSQYFNTIKENADVTSDEYVFLYGRQ